jgi:hypothetical protein
MPWHRYYCKGKKDYRYIFKSKDSRNIGPKRNSRLENYLKRQQSENKSVIPNTTLAYITQRTGTFPGSSAILEFKEKL